MLLASILIATTAVALGSAFAVFWVRRRRQRRANPKDYAYVVYRDARGTDLYEVMSRRLPWLTPANYESLIVEFTAVDMSIRALAKRSTGGRLSSTYVREALSQLHPFLKHEGLRRAVRTTRRRSKTQRRSNVTAVSASRK